MKTNYPLFKSDCFFASDFRSFAGAPISLDVLLHVLEVVLELLNPVRSSCGSDRQLVPVVPVDSIPQVSCVRPFLFLFFSIPQTSLLFNISVLVPHLQSAAGHHNQALHIILELVPAPITLAAEFSKVLDVPHSLPLPPLGTTNSFLASPNVPTDLQQFSSKRTAQAPVILASVFTFSKYLSQPCFKQKAFN